jgi:hypothetical protein
MRRMGISSAKILLKNIILKFSTGCCDAAYMATKIELITNRLMQTTRMWYKSENLYSLIFPPHHCQTKRNSTLVWQ